MALVKPLQWYNSSTQDKCINEAVGTGTGTSVKLLENVEFFVSAVVLWNCFRIKKDMLKFYFGCLFGVLKGFRENWKSPLEVEKINGLEGERNTVL